MANETIELLKNYDPKKMPWPAGAQEKFDGVPIIIIKHSASNIQAYTRQNEVVSSLTHIVAYANVLIQADEGFIVGEVYTRDLPFKTISGLVRQFVHTREHRQLYLRVFDANILNSPAMDWEARRRAFENALANLAATIGAGLDDMPVRAIPTIAVSDPDEAEAVWRQLQLSNPNVEGMVLHSTRKKWSPGKRCWGTQRIKDKPTIELHITDFEEAKEGGTLAGKGMVGRLIAELHSIDSNGKHNISYPGVGPGKLTHEERKALWAQWKMGRFKPRIAEVQYMPDPTYDALRQPTFQRWRDDKSEAQTLVAPAKA